MTTVKPRHITKHYSYVGICTDGYIFYLSTSSERTLVQQMEDLYVTNDYQISEEELDIETEKIKSTVIINKVGSKINQIQKASRPILKPSYVEVKYKNGEVEVMSRRRFKGRYDVHFSVGSFKEGNDMFDIFCITEIKSLSVRKPTVKKVGLVTNNEE